MSSRDKYRGYYLVRERDGWAVYLDERDPPVSSGHENIHDAKDAVDALYESDRESIFGKPSAK